MRKAMLTMVAVVLSSSAVGAFDLGRMSAKDVATVSPETPTVVSAPVNGLTVSDVTKAAGPITSPVALKSPAFAELLVKSLNVEPKLLQMAGGQSYLYKVGDGLTCYKSYRNDIHLPDISNKARYSCEINLAGGWKSMGMESYGSGDNREFSIALYNALNVKEMNEEGVKIKTLEFEQPDQDGGTERNQIGCSVPTPEVEAMGLRPSCQLLNAL
jgi:hypothetical protein